MKRTTLFLLLLISLSISAQRTEQLLTEWQIAPERYTGVEPTSGWNNVRIPHDWAIGGEFDRKYDLQKVMVVQNGENTATWKTGRSGGLPWMGCYWYRTAFNVQGIMPADRRGPRGRQYELIIDGAMSNAQVFIDGRKVIYWPYGYNSFHVDLTPYLSNGPHKLSIRLENKEQSSRWYPGAGLFRNVHLVSTEPVHIPVWGTTITTPSVSEEEATVKLSVLVENSADHAIRIATSIVDLTTGMEVEAGRAVSRELNDTTPIEMQLTVKSPKLWSPEHPYRYEARTQVYVDEALSDSYTTPFGIRTTEYRPHEGFFLNGEKRKFKGVCLHHDFGALGTAVDRDAIRHQLTMLRDMGCDAIRTSHNMPAPELVELCDEMGLMMMIESFDVWDLAKCENDYHLYFNELETHNQLGANRSIKPLNPQLRLWSERDIVNMVTQYRNHPCVMMWSVGNEVWNQTKADGWKVAQRLIDICHREDPTRPVTCGMDQAWCIGDNGFGAVFDIPGLNYRTARYQELYKKLPQGLILGSETASTVSSRGTYKFPVTIAPDQIYDDNQCSGYDVEYCSWSGLPDQDFALQDDYPWTIGQFVWTGIDYLGEPSPYDTDAWPSHSSYFGIIDLAMLPKDRYWLYRSQWNKEEPTLHTLPHWTWPGREGEVTPVFVYTSYPEAELFINGESQGRRVFATADNCASAATVPVGDFKVADWGCAPEPQLLPRYRLMWLNSVYQPGEMKVMAYANVGDSVAVDSTVMYTADKPTRLELEWANAEELKDRKAGEEHLYYFTCSVSDKWGQPCPTATDEVTFAVKGNASIAGVANGDAACLDPLSGNMIHLFAGQATVIVRATGSFTVKAQTKALRPAQKKIQ